MHILHLPAELLQLILINAILERGIRRGLHLRVVCKHFAEEVMPALYSTHLLDTHCSLLDRPPADVRARYLHHRVLGAKSDVTPSMQTIRRTAEHLMADNEIPLSDEDACREYLKALCTLATKYGNCLETRHGHCLTRFFRDEVIDEANDGRRRSGHQGFRDILVAAAYMNFMPIMQRNIGLVPSPLEPSAFFGRPLQAAAVKGHNAVLELLLSNTNSTSKDRYVALMAASKGGQLATVTMLLEDRWGKWTTESQGEFLDRTLADGLETPSPEVFELFMVLRRKVMPVEKASLSQGKLGDLLYAAARNRYTEIACYLLDDYGAPVDGWPHRKGPISKKRPIIEACRHGDIRMVHKMLQHHADTTDAMTTAAGGGYLAIVRLLIEHGASMNEGSPPAIVRAVELEHTAMFRLLREHGARLNTTGTGGEAVSRAKGQGLDSMLEMLREEGLGIEYFFASNPQQRPQCQTCRWPKPKRLSTMMTSG